MNQQRLHFHVRGSIWVEFGRQKGILRGGGSGGEAAQIDEDQIFIKC